MAENGGKTRKKDLATANLYVKELPLQAVVGWGGELKV